MGILTARIKTSNQKILVVDDSLTIRMQVKELLEESGFQVMLAEDGLNCLEALEEEAPEVILLDIIMPKMDGIEVCRRVKSDHRFKDIPILILTTVTHVENKVKGLQAGADDYITKPFDIAELVARVNVLIRNKELQDELRLANQKIVEQHKALIEEERLKILLQMAGTTAHKLNQPLMVLLGNIELMEVNKNNPERLLKYMAKIYESGQRIADIVKKIQTIRHDDSKPYFGDSTIINLDQEIKILSVEDLDEDFEVLNNLLKDNNQINLTRAKNIEDAMKVLEQGRFDLILLDYLLSDGNGFDFFQRMNKRGLEVPVVIITGQGNDLIASKIIQAGAYDYLPKAMTSAKSISRVIVSTLEKARLKKDIEVAQKKIAEMSTRDK
jgi:two-component system cell cycle response regulator